MAECPACGKKLHLYNWKPNCPQCGVNLNYYKSNEKLLNEAEKTEIEHSKFQPKVDRAKAATIGTATGRIRMAFFLLPVLSLLLPLFSITAGNAKKNYNAIEIYNTFSLLDTNKVLGNISPLIISVLLIAIPAVCCIVFTIMQIAAGTKKGTRKNIVLSGISVTLVAASLISFFVFAKNPAKAYTDLVINEAETALAGTNQKNADDAVKKIQAITGESTLEKDMLNKSLGQYASSGSLNTFLTKDEQKTLDEAYNNATKEQNEIDSIRESTASLMSSIFTYSKLQTVINECINDAVLHDDEVYSDECLADLLKATEEAKDYLKNDIECVSTVKNNGEYSESSFNNLTAALEEANGYLDKLNKGELIIELTDDDGTGEKTEKEQAQETAQTLQNSINRVNGAFCGLVNITALNENMAVLNGAAESDGFGKNISASAGPGMIIFLIFFIAQLAFNIQINKKGIKVKYKECLIGGLPSKEYFDLVSQGKTNAEIRRVMLVRLAKMQDEVRIAQEEAEKKAEQEKLNEIKERMNKTETEVKK